MTNLENRISALEVEVQQLRDLEAIRTILARYGPLADTASNAERRGKTGELFAEDGVYDLGEHWQATGPTAIGELLNNPNHIDLLSNGSAHVMGMPYITLNGDKATALSYSRVYRHEKGEFKVWRVSANYWQCTRIGEEWKVTHRTNRLLDGSDDARELLKKVDDETG